MEKLVIKKETPIGVKIFFTLLALTIFLVGIGGAYFAGSHFSTDGNEKAISQNQFLAEENARLSEEVKTKMSRLAELQQEVITSNSEIALQKMTSAELKKAVDEEMRRRLLVEKELSFYRKVSKKKSSKFSLSRISLRKDPESSQIRYQFTIRKMKKDNVKNTGSVQLSIIGKRAGAKETIRVPELGKPPLVYGFKIFQAFEGEVVPDDEFKPEKLKVVMVDKESGKDVFEKTYSWADVFAP